MDTRVGQQDPEDSEEQEKLETTGCKVIYGAILTWSDDDNELIHHYPIPLTLGNRIGSSKYQLCKALVWHGRVSNPATSEVEIKKFTNVFRTVTNIIYFKSGYIWD